MEGGPTGQVVFREPLPQENGGIWCFALALRGRLSRMGQNLETFPCIFADGLPD